MPVPTIAGETRGVETHDSADFTGAEAGNELLKAGARHGATGRSAKIVVDDLNIAKTPAASVLDEIVLAALALAIDLDLRLGGLAHIYDRLTAQDHRW